MVTNWQWRGLGGCFCLFVLFLKLSFDCMKSYPSGWKQKSAIVFHGPLVPVLFYWGQDVTKFTMYLKSHWCLWMNFPWMSYMLHCSMNWGLIPKRHRRALSIENLYLVWWGVYICVRSCQNSSNGTPERDVFILFYGNFLFINNSWVERFFKGALLSSHSQLGMRKTLRLWLELMSQDSWPSSF
jgi:hypothetical protein